MFKDIVLVKTQFFSLFCKFDFKFKFKRRIASLEAAKTGRGRQLPNID